MGLILLGAGWVISMFMYYIAFLSRNDSVIAFMVGAAAITCIGSAFALRNPLDRHSPLWVAIGWTLGVAVNYFAKIDVRFYIPSALWGGASAMLMSILLYYIENHTPRRCSVCGEKAALRSQFEIAYGYNTPYVFVDYGEWVCASCEARMLERTHEHILRGITDRIMDVRRIQTREAEACEASSSSS